MIEALDIHVTGIVQGVGFRPFIYRLAKRHVVNGWVLNAADGVTIHAEGESDLLDEFVLEISENAPAASRVEEIELKEVPLQDFTSFEIRFSDETEVEKTTLVSPDLGICDDCARELFDPGDRRYHYPFINCTNCGPRFTIIEQLPYDRVKTSMKSFPMCDECSREYADPADRRFHAQPDACFECGPHLSFSEDAGERVIWGDTLEESDAIIARAVELLYAGSILAVKGLGGFHLVCDASNETAIARLRERKRREGKPFAVMVRTVEDARQWCMVDDEEARVLESPARPIVLLKKRACMRLARGLADRLTELGVMLPATPVQHLLLAAFDGMLVATSGNVHDNPIEIDDEHAYHALSRIADAFLGNDRAIRSRYDDSVVRVIRAGGSGEAMQMIRRARGFAPLPLTFPPIDGERVIFATGPEQKNTFCLARSGEAFVSQHIGDMESVEANDAWLEAKRTYQGIFEEHPSEVVSDMHPEYLTSKWAENQSLPVVRAQHHHAHIVSVMAENALEGPVCGIAFDGTGYGVDGAIWGGEVLICNTQEFERLANFSYIPLPGGAAAIKNPLRCAYAALWAFDLLDHPAAQDALEALGDTADICSQMIDKGVNCPYTSSAGRLFDAASALLDICRAPAYEGEGAVLLEAAIFDDGIANDFATDAARWEERLSTSLAPHGESSGVGHHASDYRIDVMKNVAGPASTAQDTSVVLMDAAPLFKALLDDMHCGVPTNVIARRFHDAFVEAIVAQAQLAEALYGIRTVVLSGGVFMNRYLVEHSLAALESAGFVAAINRDLPPNDGSLSYGQAMIAAQ